MWYSDTGRAYTHNLIKFIGHNKNLKINYEAYAQTEPVTAKPDLLLEE
jgi:hypothetical protein